MAKVIRFEVETDEGEQTLELPGKYEVCDDCEGEGVTLHGALRGAFTASEFRECFDDEESREEYFRGGHGNYGVTCKSCGGDRVVLVVDEAKAEAKDPAILKLYFEQQRAEVWRREEEATERRMEAYLCGERD